MSADTIYSVIEEAFEEGAKSPYEMKPYVVTELSGKLQTKLNSSGDIQSIQDLANVVSKLLPQPIRTLLTQYRVWLCGGAILRILIDPLQKTTAWKSSDFDLYMTPEECNKLPFKGSNDPTYKAKSKFKTYRAEWQDRNINLVVSPEFTAPERILEDFDLSVVQFAYSENQQPTLSTYQRSWSHLLHGQLHLVADKNRTVQTVNRVKKYVKRGFRDCTGLVETGVLGRVLAETRY